MERQNPSQQTYSTVQATCKTTNRVLGIRWPNRISNKKVYQRTGEYPISLFVLKQRWQLFRHILRSDPMSPANQAMKFYFKPSKAKGFRGRPCATIATTIDSDIKRIAATQPQNIMQTIPLRKFESLAEAQDRDVWQKFTNIIFKAAEAEITI